MKPLKLISLIVLLIAACAVRSAGQSFTNSETILNEQVPMEFEFYGMTCQMPSVEIPNLPAAVGSQEEYSALLTSLKWSRFAKKILPYFNSFANEAKLNDYLTFRLVAAYIDASFPGVHNSVRATLKQHLIDQMGFESRLGLNPMGDGIIFLAFAQPVYDMKMIFESPFRYYAVPDGENRLQSEAETDFTLLKLTSNDHKNRPVNLRLSPLEIPYRPEPFEFTDGNLTLKGEVNANLRSILYNYPRTNLDELMASEPEPALRQSIVEQLRGQLAGLKQKEAVNSLLAFIQTAFPYQTDEELHGFEKPYFIEEMFLQPASDCEDRSMLYSFLLREVLGVPNVIVGYDDHVAVAVHLDQSSVRGAKIEVDGKDYYISDPTYKGARTGRVMPGYEDKVPEVYFR